METDPVTTKSVQAFWKALVVVAGLVVTANIARSAFVPSGMHFAFNVALALIVVLVGRVAGLGWPQLGIDRRSVRAGLRWGGGAFGVIAFVAVAAALVPATRGFFDIDEASITGGRLAERIFVVIPIGTVIVEELIFRGVIHGLLTRLFTTVRVVSIGAVVFGLWHVFPAWRGDDGGAGIALGTFVATSLAGAGFIWLRMRSDSLVAPMLAHLGTNTVPLTVAWFVHRMA